MTLLIRLFFVSYIETIIVWLWIQVRSNQRSSFTKISTKHVKHFLYKNTIGAQGGHKWPQWVLGTRVNNLAGSVKREIFDMNNNCQPMRTSAMVEARDLKWLRHTYVCPVHLTRNVCSVKEKNRGKYPKNAEWHGTLDPPSNYRSSNHENPIKPDRIRHDMGKNSTKAIVCSLRYIPILSLCYKVVFFNDCAKNDTL